MDEAASLGTLLGLFMRYGRENVQNAFAALSTGTATPEQQKIVSTFIQGLVGR